MADVYFVRQVIEEDLRHVGRHDIPHIFKKLALLESDPHAGMPLGRELTTFRKLVVGRNTYRIVYRLREGGATIEVCEIWAIGHRRNDEVYAEATRRVQQAASGRPELISLAEAMTAVRQLSTRLTGEPVEPPDPVPEWLYRQLVHTAGMPPHEVAAMTGEKAFAAWNEWMARPR